MNNLYQIIKFDYLQRVRSYRFLIICCFSLAFAYITVPAPDASYTTIRLSNFIGEYNSAWVAYSSAIITSVFLGLFGFFLINGGMKKDLDTGIGQIFSATGISNRTYLIAKLLSSFAVLISILLLIMLVAIGLFFGYSQNQSFEISHFLIAFSFIPLPTLFFTAAISVIMEVLIIKRTVIQNIVVYALFVLIIGSNANNGPENIILDLYGTGPTTLAMVNQVEALNANGKEVSLNIGFMVTSKKPSERFQFKAPNIDLMFCLTRLGVILFSLLTIALIAPFFHRFDLQKSIKKPDSTSPTLSPESIRLNLSEIPKVYFDPSIIPLIKMELWMHYKNTSKWILMIIVGFMIAMIFAPSTISHQILLPITWFLLIDKLAGLITKEQSSNMHYFAYSSYEPIKRLLLSQLLGGLILVLTTALPLLLRLVFHDPLSAILVLFGGVLLVSGSALSGILSGGRRLFEVLFFFLSYLALNKLPIADYYGGFHDDLVYTALLLSIACILSAMVFITRQNQIRHS